MTEHETDPGRAAPRPLPSLLDAQCRRLIEAGGHDPAVRCAVVYAQPAWDQGDGIDIGGVHVIVRPAVSQLAALAALVARPPDAYLVILSNLEDRELGDSVLARCWKHHALHLDQWAELPALFGAVRVEPELRNRGSWAARELLARTPAAGWPKTPGLTLTSRHALTCLLVHVLRGEPADTVDLPWLIGRLDSEEGRDAWHALDDETRRRLQAWARDEIGEAAELALAAAGRQDTAETLGRRSRVPLRAIGLAADVLWPRPAGPADPVPAGCGPAQDEATARARACGRAETGWFGPRHGPVAAVAARELADAAVDAWGAAPSGERSRLAGVAEKALADVGWAVGAELSRHLPAGQAARIRAVAEAAAKIVAAAPGDPRLAEPVLRQLDERLEWVRRHDLSRTDEDRAGVAGLRLARATVRLARWLAEPAPAPEDLAEAVSWQVNEGGLIDRAYAAVWKGSEDRATAAALKPLAAAARERRARIDRTVAEDIEAVANPTPAALERLADRAVRPIERVRGEVLAPLARQGGRLLLIVIDALSAAVAESLVESAAPRGWVELVPEAAGRRAAALAALPSVTQVCRTSLFEGRIAAGGADAETAAWLRGRPNGPVFHKRDLAGGAGEPLGDQVRSRILGEEDGAVAVVLNTIDDALDKADPGGTDWTEETVGYLGPLLNAAALGDRLVVLTGDHGHVVERGSEARPAKGGGARWRPVAAGPAGAGEVLARGGRVLTPTGDVVLACSEDLRYAAKKSGYHGGAALAELAVPLILLRHGATKPPAGWRPRES